VCRKDVEPVWDDQEPIQPSEGLACKTDGNYGSKVLDNIAGEPSVYFVLCDACFIKAADDDLLAYYPDNLRRAKQYKVDMPTRLWSESVDFADYARLLQENDIDPRIYGLDEFVD
jgi:hypothetical protein